MKNQSCMELLLHRPTLPNDETNIKSAIRIQSVARGMQERNHPHSKKNNQLNTDNNQSSQQRTDNKVSNQVAKQSEEQSTNYSDRDKNDMNPNRPEKSFLNTNNSESHKDNNAVKEEA